MATANGQGVYQFAGLAGGTYWMEVSYIGYATMEKVVKLDANTTQNFTLSPLAFIADEVMVSATRATKQTGTTYLNMNRETLAKNNNGRDLPYILDQTPSVVVSSDAGAGIGYTGIRIRGSDATRINVTLNGIPLNDAESQGSFFVNLPDMASSIDNIQIQRGVGTSTNGAGAFGASLNIQTTTRRDSAYAELNNTYGSFDTWKNTVSVGSGLINNKFTFDGRLSRIKSDGYVDRAFSDLKSFFVTGAYYGKNDILRANVFSGKEKTYQAWNGIPEVKLKNDKQGIEDYIINNGIGSGDADKLRNANPRTYNSFTYENQTDNYQQDHYQLFYTRNLGNKLVANVALHYTYGRGYYEEFRDNEALVDGSGQLTKYKIQPVVVDWTTQTSMDLVRQLWLDNHFYGTTYSLNYKPGRALNLTLGGAYNQYNGRHYDQVVWAQYANYSVRDQAGSSSSITHIYDDNDAFKSDFNIFGRATYQLDKLDVFADLQYRNVFYSYFGLDENANPGQQNARLQFFNPKFGLTYNFNNSTNVYASIAVGNKEPNRNDFTDSNVNTRPKPENLKDIEFGYRKQGDIYNIGVNGFAMLYKDQLINTGKLNDVGGQTRQNVPDSYRMGLEFDGGIKLLDELSASATLTLSRHKIKEFTEYIYDATEDENDSNCGNILITSYKNVNIAYSPAIIASGTLVWNPIKNAEVAWIGKYVGRQNLDNTGDDKRILPSFFVNDVRLGYNFKALGAKNIGLSLLLANLFNKQYENNGGSYSYLYGGQLSRGNYYYPQAGTNFLFSLNVKF